MSSHFPTCRVHYHTCPFFIYFFARTCPFLDNMWYNNVNYAQHQIQLLKKKETFNNKYQAVDDVDAPYVGSPYNHLKYLAKETLAKTILKKIYINHAY